MGKTPRNRTTRGGNARGMTLAIPFFPRPLAPPNSGGNISVTFRKPPRLSEPRTACFPPAQFRESFIAPT